MSMESPVFTKKFVAEFNTSQDSLRQLAQIEWNVDELFRMIYNSGLDKQDIPAIKTLFHYLVYTYADRIHALSWSTLQIEINNHEEELTILYNDWITKHKEEIPYTLISKLRLFKRWLYEIKQKQIKVGIPTKPEHDAREATKKALEG